MDIPTIVQHALNRAYKALNETEGTLLPFSYVIRDGVADVLGKQGMEPDAAVEHLKNLIRPLPGLTHYCIVWEAPHEGHERAIHVECGSSDMESALTHVQPFAFKKKGIFFGKSEPVAAAKSVLQHGPSSRIYRAED